MASSVVFPLYIHCEGCIQLFMLLYVQYNRITHLFFKLSIISHRTQVVESERLGDVVDDSLDGDDLRRRFEIMDSFLVDQVVSVSR